MYYELKIHGRTEYFKIVDGQPYIAGYSSKKKEGIWHPTVVTPERMKRMKLIGNDAVLLGRLNEKK